MNDCLPPWRLLLTAIGVTVLSYFPVGYHHAVLNVAHETFQKLINKSLAERYNSGQPPSWSQLSTIWSVTVSSWQMGALLGSLNAFWCVDRLGRKCTLMLIAGAFQLIGSIFMILAPPYGYFELLILGRLLSGISTGLVCPSLRVFLSECSPDKYRGTLNSFAGFVVAIAIVSAMGAGLPEALGTGATYHAQLLLGMCLPLAVLQMVSYPLFPATPKFLYLTRKLRKEAENSILFYHGLDADISSVFKELERERRLASEDLSFLQALRLKTVRFPLIIAMVAGVAYSSIGVDVVDAYSTEMFVELGMPAWESKLASMLFNVAGIIGAIIAIFVVDRLRRRYLLLGTLFTCVVCNIALMAVGALGKYAFGGSSIDSQFGVIAAVLIGIMTFAYALGPSAVLENLFAEISPHKVRSVAGSISEVAFWSTTSFYVLVFHPATVSIGTFAVLIYTFPLLVCTFYFLFYLPETAQKSVADVAEQILALSKKKKRMRVKSDNSVSSAATTATTICDLDVQYNERKNGQDDESRHLLSVRRKVDRSGPAKAVCL